MRNICDDCRNDFDDALPGTWLAVKGWVVERSAGGANTIRDKQYLGGVICPPCGKLRDLGVRRDQGTLL